MTSAPRNKTGSENTRGGLQKKNIINLPKNEFQYKITKYDIRKIVICEKKKNVLILNKKSIVLYFFGHFFGQGNKA